MIVATLIGPITNPVLVFLIMIAIMLIAPLLFERVNIPGIIGLILAGVLVGPYGLGMLERDDTIILLGTVGLLFLMFMAGLETSLDDLKANAKGALIFGVATFILPMLFGTGAMVLLGYNFLAAVLVASCLASHTLVALPIAARLGIMRLPAITATLGGTLVTNVLALLVLAVVVRAHQGELTLQFWLTLIPSLTVYTVAALWGIPRLGRWFFRQFGHDEGAEFTFVLTTLFVAAYGAEMIGVEPVVGAFLAGTAITPLIPGRSPLMNRLQFIGNTLFIPFFLISVGMLINPGILIGEPRSLLVAGAMVGAEVSSKFLAAWIPGRWFGWAWNSTMTVFGLSVAQAAATLAAITVAFNIELVDELTVNGTIAMIMVTCILSPIITRRWGKVVNPAPAEATTTERVGWGQRVLVPVANPNTEQSLLNLALLLTKSAQGTLLPLNVLRDRGQGIPAAEQVRQNQLLSVAESLAHAAVTKVERIARVDNSIEQGIVHAVYEHQPSLVVVGWKGYSSYTENLFGGIIDRVLQRAGVPILVTRLMQPLEATQRILFAVPEGVAHTPRVIAALDLAHTLATELKAPLQMLLSETRQLTPTNFGLPNGESVSCLRRPGSLVNEVVKAHQSGDLLVLLPGIRTTPLGRPTMGNAPETVARIKTEASIVVLYLPPAYYGFGELAADPDEAEVLEPEIHE